jgi:hypothetical protein
VIFHCAGKLHSECTGQAHLAGNIEIACDHRPVRWASGLNENMKNRMTVAAYDILKKDAIALVWVEAVHDLETARSRVKELTAGSEVEYVIFDQRTRKIVPNFDASIARL